MENKYWILSSLTSAWFQHCTECFCTVRYYQVGLTTQQLPATNDGKLSVLVTASHQKKMMNQFKLPGFCTADVHGTQTVGYISLQQPALSTEFKITAPLHQHSLALSRSSKGILKHPRTILTVAQRYWGGTASILHKSKLGPSNICSKLLISSRGSTTQRPKSSSEITIGLKNSHHSNFLQHPEFCESKRPAGVSKHLRIEASRPGGKNLLQVAKRLFK